MSEWAEIKIGTHCKLQGGFAFKSKDFTNTGIPVVKIKNIQNRIVTLKDSQCFPERNIGAKLDKFKLYNGDILIAMTGAGSVGRVGKLISCKDDFGLLNQRVGRFDVDSDYLNREFLYYVLTQPSYQEALYMAGSGSGQPNLSPSQIESFKIKLPPLQEQKAVAKILGDLDDKIELNRKMNETLEQIAQALFISWFVDFDPVIDNALAEDNELSEELQVRAEKRKSAPDHLKLIKTNPELASLFPSSFSYCEELNKWIPEGWEVKSFGDEFNVTMGQSPPGSSYNEQQEGLPFFQGKTDFGFRFPKNRIYCTEPKRIAQKNDTLISVRAPVGNANLSSSECAIGRGLSAVRHISNSISYTYYSVLELRREFDIYEGEGTVFGSINQKDLKGIQIIKPTENLIEKFDKICQSYDRQIELKTEQIESLSDIRDRLLPQLISGKLKVANGY